MTESPILLVPREVLYCGACGMPNEFCAYGPDFESHCAPWLKKHHPAIFEQICLSHPGRSSGSKKEDATITTDNNTEKPPRPSQPRTNEERLVAFYEEYQPDKVDGVPALLEKYAGKEDKLFTALTTKYGDEPQDPYYSDSDDDDDDDDDDEDDNDEDLGEGELADLKLAAGDKKKRRGAGAKKKKKDDTASIRVVVQKRAQNKRRFLTVVLGLETVPDAKLKDISKAFSKKFAGSSSVKDGTKGSKEKEVIIQGDHMYDVAEMLVDKFGVPDTAVFLDIDGDVVALR